MRHLAPEHVPEVGELVEGVAAHDGADARDPRIARCDREPGPGELGAGDHRPQLEDLKATAIPAHTGLAVDRIAAGFEPDREQQCEHDWRGQNRADRATVMSKARLIASFTRGTVSGPGRQAAPPVPFRA